MRRIDPRAWPIRWRLTALNVGVVAITLLALGGIFLLQLDTAMIDLNADYLRDQARPTVQVPRFARPPLAESERSAQEPPTPNLPRLATGIVRRLSGPDTGVVVFDDDGAIVASSETNEGVEPWPQPAPDQLRAALDGREGREVVSQQSRRTLVLVLPLRTADGSIVGALELAKSLELTDQLGARLRVALMVGTLLAMLIAGGLGLRATRTALQPLDRVIRAARRIGAGRLDERLRLDRRDEVGALAEAFDSMLDRLAAVVTAQRRFVADAAHELRTPLTALGGMTEMLQMGADRGDPSTVRRMLDVMDREISRLGRLVTDLLTLSRLDAEQPLTTTPVDLAPLVSEVANQTRLLANGQEVRVRIEDRPFVRGDADRLKQVLLNLTANALAFTPPEGRVELRLEQRARQARLIVADTGSGIAPDVLPRVMDRFVRGDPSRARATGGSGLGLAIAQGIVDAHGGTIAIDSRLDEGTTVTISLPLSESVGPSGNFQLSRVEASGRAEILEPGQSRRGARV